MELRFALALAFFPLVLASILWLLLSFGCLRSVASR